MENKEITLDKIKKYREITEKAFSIAKQNISKNRKKDAQEILKMAEAYLSDSKHFEKKGDLINSFGCIYYSHGWLDCGARLKIFDVDDDELFTI